MTLIQYSCQLVQQHTTLKMKRDKTQKENEELDWLGYKLQLVRNAQRRCG